MTRSVTPTAVKLVLFMTAIGLGAIAVGAAMSSVGSQFKVVLVGLASFLSMLPFLLRRFRIASNLIGLLDLLLAGAVAASAVYDEVSSDRPDFMAVGGLLVLAVLLTIASSTLVRDLRAH
ncbi:MAG: hypothetical protein AMXMBFR36_26670 [Acidobacteriota bacterium]